MIPNQIQDCRVLIVDDEPANVTLLERILAQGQYRNLESATDPRNVAAIFKERQPDIVLLDLLMPHLDGFKVMEQLSQYRSPNRFLPILVITADVSQATRLRALSGGATDFLTKPIDQTEVMLRMHNLLQMRLCYLHLEDKVRERTAELEQRVRELTALNTLFQQHLGERFEVAEAYRALSHGLESLLSQTQTLAQHARVQKLPDLQALSGIIKK